jgi:hypothetical protein
MLKVQLLVFAYVFLCLLIICTLMMEVMLSSETSLLTRARRCHFIEDGILHSRRRVNLKPYINGNMSAKSHISSY